jgi:cytochrome c biogenesis protein CcdA
MNVEPGVVTLPLALLMGLAFGAGPCNVTCLPYLGPVLLRHDGDRRAWRSVLPFSLGRLTGYAGLGLAAGLAGRGLSQWLQSSLAAWLLGGATLLVGLSLWRRGSRCRRPCANPTGTGGEISVAPPGPAPARGGLFAMGAGMALNPCLPLTTVLAAAAVSGNAAAGVGLGLAFGAGAVVVPTLVFGLAVAHLGSQLRQHLDHWRPHLERGAASLLMLLGFATLLGWVRP